MIEIPLRLKYRVGGKGKKGKRTGDGNSGKSSLKGKLFPVGIRKRPKVRRYGR